MQQRINNGSTKVDQKHGSLSNRWMRIKNEESTSKPVVDSNPLENVTCKIGDNTCAAGHVSEIRRTGLFHPMNGNQKAKSLLGLQQQYGNRFVQKVIARMPFKQS